MNQNDPSAQLQTGANDNKVRKTPKHRQWGGATLGLLFGIGGLIAGRLGQLYPDFDVFAQFGIQFIAISIAFSIALFFRRFKFQIGTIITLFLLVLYGAWPHFISTTLSVGPFQLQAEEKKLSIAHFNPLAGNLDHPAITKEVLRLDADLVSLVEIDPNMKLTIIPALQVKYPYSYDCSGTDYCQNIILSKYPILNGDGQGHWIGPPYSRVHLGGEMTGVTFVSVHTTRFPQSRDQLRQVRELLRLLESESGDLIVMGDFNATPFSRITTTLEQGANIRRLTDLPTWPSRIHLPQVAIDHAFASENFRVIGKQQIGEAAGSDHYPIILTLARKQPQ